MDPARLDPVGGLSQPCRESVDPKAESHWLINLNLNTTIRPKYQTLFSLRLPRATELLRVSRQYSESQRTNQPIFLFFNLPPPKNPIFSAVKAQKPPITPPLFWLALSLAAGDFNEVPRFRRNCRPNQPQIRYQFPNQKFTYTPAAILSSPPTFCHTCSPILSCLTRSGIQSFIFSHNYPLP